MSSRTGSRRWSPARAHPLVLLFTMVLLAACLPGVAAASEGSVAVGIGLQGDRLVGPGARFVEGPPLAFRAALDDPVDALEITVRVYDTDGSGGERVVLSDAILVDPSWTVLTGSIGALPPGTYVVRLFRDADRIATGSFSVVALPTPAPTPRPTPTPTPAPTPSPGPSLPIEGMSWQLVEMSDGSVMNPVPDQAGITLLLLDGIATGSTGCNDYRAPYTIVGSEIVFGFVTTGFRACDDETMMLESNLLQALSYVARFDARDAGLLFVSPPGAPLLAWVAAPEGELVGRWVLAALQGDDGSLVGTDPSTRVTTTFREDGTLEGNDGCNAFTGSWTTTGNQLAVDGLSGTRAACPSEALSDQETRFLSSLLASTSWSATTQQLVLRDTAGRVTLVYGREGAAPPAP